MDKKHDVVIIGAGLSGLSAANLLNDSGIDVVVLEASDRIGGRLHTVHNDKIGFVDIGGQYVGPTQDHVLNLAKKLGVATKDVYNKNDIIVYRKGKTKRFSGILPPMGSIKDMMDNSYLLRKINELCEQVDLKEPWNSKDAEILDQMSYQEWIDKMISSEAVKDDAILLTRLNMTAEPCELSLLWTLWYTKAAGGIYKMNAVNGGAQEKTFRNGAQQLPIKLAQLLPGRVFVNKPVCRIVNSKDSVAVYTMNQEKYEADYVIIATPPAAQLRITFEPPLPALRNQLIQRMPLGSVIKTITYYDKPYWRLKGLQGLTFVEDEHPDHFVVSTIDECDPGSDWGAIVGFIAGDKARQASTLSKEERKLKVAQQYSKLFDCKEMTLPMHYEEKNWMEDPWAGGCYTGVMAPGIMTAFGRTLREPVGRVHFAGTETATMWTGYMDGAIQAGERAAREMLFKFGKCNKEDIFENNIEQEDYPSTFLERNTPSSQAFVRSLAAFGITAAGAAIAGRYIWSKL